MSTVLHPTLAQAMLAMAPPQSVVHHIVSDVQAQNADLENMRLKQFGELVRRANARAMRLQIEHPLFGVKS